MLLTIWIYSDFCNNPLSNDFLSIQFKLRIKWKELQRKAFSKWNQPFLKGSSFLGPSKNTFSLNIPMVMLLHNIFCLSETEGIVLVSFTQSAAAGGRKVSFQLGNCHALRIAERQFFGSTSRWQCSPSQHSGSSASLPSLPPKSGLAVQVGLACRENNH